MNKDKPLEGISFTPLECQNRVRLKHFHIRIDYVATNLIQFDEFGREIVYAPITILSDVLLPGKGQKGKNCGKIASIGICPKCGYKVFLRSSCYQPLCPSCWHKWRFKRAKEYLIKLEGFRRHIYVERGRRWTVAKFHHVVLSPPQNLEYPLLVESETPEKKRFFNRLINEAKKIATIVGFFDGGLLIFHPFRLKWPCPNCEKWFKPDELREHLKKDHMLNDNEIEEIMRKIREQDDDPINEARRWREILKKDDWYNYVYFAPHFHAFGVASTIDGSVCKKVYEKTGWVVHRVISKRNISISDLDDLARSLLYCLSHVGIFTEKIRTIRWFGRIAQFKTRNRKEIEKKVLIALLKAQKRLRDAPKVIIGKVELICPKCGTPLKLIYVKRLEESERERIMDLRQTKAPPPIKLDPKQDKNG